LKIRTVFPHLKKIFFVNKYYLIHSKRFEDITQGKTLLGRICFGILGMILFLVLWSIAGYLIFHQPGYEQFSGFLPWPTLKAFAGLITESHFWSSVYASLRRILIGIAISFVIGLPMGILIGYYKKLEMTMDTPIQFIRMISPLSWMPIALLVFKSFESAIYFLITMATVWPIIINTSQGVDLVNRRWIDMARSQGARDRHIIFLIIIPSSIPYTLTSLRLALGVAWIVLVPAEFLGISSGLGYIINDARDTMEYDRLMATVLSIGVVGFFLDGFIRSLQKTFVRVRNNA
jgi:NitT/TauT family transport system permease protein